VTDILTRNTLHVLIKDCRGILSLINHFHLSHCSPSSSESSEDDCTEQIAALEALIVELQETKRDMEKDEDTISLIAETMEAGDVIVAQDFPAHKEGSSAGEPGTPSDPPLSWVERPPHSPLKHGSSLDLPTLDKKKRIEEMEEKEKILSECRNQIKVRPQLCLVQ